MLPSGDIFMVAAWASLERLLLDSGVVVQVGSQPALDFGEAHSLAPAVVLGLVTADLTHAEVALQRVCEVETADG